MSATILFSESYETQKLWKGKKMRYKLNFVKFLLEVGALTFGDFTLKSGRKSPYMINTAKFDTGERLSKLGCFYARAIREKMELGILPDKIDVLFGSAYKGIPLATATSIALSAAFDNDIGYCFNRKEAKDHGEGGMLVGCIPKPGDNVLIIDDVMTAGTALREVVPILKNEVPEANIVGSVLAVDRMEKGPGEKLCAVAQAQYEMGFPIFAIVDIDEIIKAIEEIQNEPVVNIIPTPEQVESIKKHLNDFKV